jgi:hypothetical protein
MKKIPDMRDYASTRVFPGKRILTGKAAARAIFRARPENLTNHPDYNFYEERMDASSEVFLPTVGQVEVTAAPGWKNYRTLLVNAGMAVGVALFTYLASVDWSEYIRADYVAYVLIIINMFLRLLTAGPAMSNVTVKEIK